MIYYKINVMEKLKEKGYSSTRLRNEKILGEKTMQQLRNNEPISIKTLDSICNILNMQPGSIIGWKADTEK